MLNRRMQILVDDELWNCLYTHAKMEGKSVGDLVREAAKKVYYNDDVKAKSAKAIEEIFRIRPKRAKGEIDYKALINYGRER